MRLRSFCLGELTWSEVEDFLKEHNTVVIPIGACEQHGPHLPLDTDAFYANWVSLRAAEKARCALVAPPVNYGYSAHHMDFPGTVSVSLRAIEKLVYDIVCSLVKHGFRKILIEDAHGMNRPAMEAVVHRTTRDIGALVAYDSSALIPDWQKYFETTIDLHGGEMTTSTALAVREDSVRKDKIKRPVMKLPKFKYIKFPIGEIYWSFRMKDLTDTGVIGDPTKATKEKGLRFWRVYIKRLAELLREMDRIQI